MGPESGQGPLQIIFIKMSAKRRRRGSFYGLGAGDPHHRRFFVYKIYFKKEKPIEVQVGRVQKRDITELVIANGKVQPVTYVKISPEVSGEIISLPVKEGQIVKKGDLLFSIKPDLYIASSNSAAANLQSALGSRDIAMYSLEKWEAEWERAKGSSRITSFLNPISTASTTPISQRRPPTRIRSTR